VSPHAAGIQGFSTASEELTLMVAESVVMVSANAKQWTEARWIPAGPLFTKWLQMP
jgi:hypothetical protein